MGDRDGYKIQDPFFIPMIVSPKVVFWGKAISLQRRPDGHHFIAGNGHKIRLVIAILSGRRHQHAGIRGKAAVDIHICQTRTIESDTSLNAETCRYRGWC